MEIKECPEVVEIWKEIDEAQVRKRKKRERREPKNV
jgi:hypothetical protein